MKKLLLSLLIFVLIFFATIPIRGVGARSGCCSWHGGVCGCQCCDGTPLSATCLPYYPGCSGGIDSFPSFDLPSYESPSYDFDFSPSIPTTPDCPINSYYDSLSGSCKCYSGYIVSGGECISTGQYCRNLYGLHASYNILTDTCECSYGYVFGEDILGNTTCVSANQVCKDQYGVMARYNSLSDKCECSIGYMFGEDILGKTQCISENQWCRDKYGFNSKYNTLKDKCECKSGYELTSKSSGLECISCFSKYGLHSSYNYLLNKCECDDGYTLDDNNQCVKKQNNVYFTLKELDTDNKKAIIKSDYDYRYYLITYNTGCYSFSFRRYLNDQIVINLGTDFDLDAWDKIVLQDDNEVCDIIRVERADSSTTLKSEKNVILQPLAPVFPQPLYKAPTSCSEGYVFSNNKCITHTEDCINFFGVNVIGTKGDDNNSFCNCEAGYEWNITKTACIKEVIIPTHPDGTLVNTLNSMGIYLIEKGRKQPIKSAEIFLGKGYKWGDVVTISQEEMNSYSLGPEVTMDKNIEDDKPPNKQESIGTLSDGMLARKKGTHGVYLIHNNKKRPIKSAEIFLGRGYKWKDITEVDQLALDIYPLGETVTLLETITIENDTQMIIINVSRLRVRSLPSLEGKIITSVLEGEEYSVIDEQTGWYKINYEGNKTGWVMSRYTK